jgi:hypothetical protein
VLDKLAEGGEGDAGGDVEAACVEGADAVVLDNLAGADAEGVLAGLGLGLADEEAALGAGEVEHLLGLGALDAAVVPVLRLDAL